MTRTLSRHQLEARNAFLQAVWDRHGADLVRRLGRGRQRAAASRAVGAWLRDRQPPASPRWLSASLQHYLLHVAHGGTATIAVAPAGMPALGVAYHLLDEVSTLLAPDEPDDDVYAPLEADPIHESRTEFLERAGRHFDARETYVAEMGWYRDLLRYLPAPQRRRELERDAGFAVAHWLDGVTYQEIAAGATEAVEADAVRKAVRRFLTAIDVHGDQVMPPDKSTA